MPRLGPKGEIAPLRAFLISPKVTPMDPGSQITQTEIVFSNMERREKTRTEGLTRASSFGVLESNA